MALKEYSSLSRILEQAAKNRKLFSQSQNKLFWKKGTYPSTNYVIYEFWAQGFFYPVEYHELEYRTWFHRYIDRYCLSYVYVYECIYFTDSNIYFTSISNICVYVCAWVCMYVCMREYVYVCVSAWVYVCGEQIILKIFFLNPLDAQILASNAE